MTIGTKQDRDHWLAWIFPASGSERPIRQVRGWDDVERLQIEHDVPDASITWEEGAGDEMVAGLGPPPGR